jgi:choline dehydrogenase
MDVLSYFKKSEDQERGPSEYHGSAGPLHVCNLRSPSPLSEAFVEAAVQSGFQRNPDFNGSSQEGFGLYQVTQWQGQRHSAAAAFLRPALRRPNLTIRTDVLVFDIVFENKRAALVSFQQDDRSVQERAEREIIVCAGAIGSPQLLMLSGIGPAHHLRSLDIPVLCDLPGVGANLQDHPAVPIASECTEPISLAAAENLPNLFRYIAMRRGPLTSNVGEGGGFIRTSSALPCPDIQYHFAPGYFVEHGFQQIKEHGYTLGPTLLHPYSRGSITLRSSNPLDAPRIQANYFADDRDMQAMVEGLKVARTLLAANAFSKYRKRELIPGPEAQDDAALRAHVAKYGETLYHPCGTCKMGQDSTAVVDAELWVRGVEGLRVVDASIMPTVPGGNTNAPTIMIAEKAADLIKGQAAGRQMPDQTLVGAAR